MPIGALDQPLFSADALGWDFPAGSFCEDFHCESSMRSHRPFHLSCLWVILRSCGWTILLQSLCLTRIYLFHVSFDGWLVCFHVSILVAFICFIKMMIFPMHVGDRVCPWSLFHCQGNFSVFCSFIRMLQLEETLLCKQCAQCVVCLWLCFVSAVPNVDNFCIFILPIVWIFWLFVALICDLWRWTERSMIILQRHSGSFHFFVFYARPVRMLSGRIQSSTLETKGCRRVRFPVYFWKPSSSFCLFYFFLRSTDVRISSSLFVVSIPDLHTVHCFRLSWTHAFDCEYICHLEFASWRSSWTRNDPWEGWAFRGMGRLGRHVEPSEFWIRKAPSMP